MKDRLPLMFAALILLAWTPFLRGQSPLPVAPCDLVNFPEKYAGKVVEVRAGINLAFEDFTLAQSGCEEKFPWVWLMYGGDESTPTASTWNDHDRKPGSVVKIDGIPVPLVHDANLDLFKRRLTATRFGTIGDTECYDCYLYKVTATLTGLFFAPVKDGKAQAGYGHLGCCYLLAIEKVADVAAEHTAIPAGAEIACERDSKELTQKDAERLNAISTSCKGLSGAECSARRFHQMEAVAARWGDSLDFQAGYFDGDGIYQHTEKSGWRTLDRLKHYKLSIQSEKPGEDENTVFGGTVTRVSCKEITPPLPLTTNLSCREISKELLPTPAELKRKFKPSDIGEDANTRPEDMQRLKDQASAIVDRAARELALSIGLGPKVVACESPLVYRRKAFGVCSWNNNSGTMRIGMNLMGPWPPKGAAQGASSWTLWSTDASVCEVER